jgi:hypothetical protein
MSGKGKNGNSRKNRQRFGKKNDEQKNDLKKQYDNVPIDEKKHISMNEKFRWNPVKANPASTPDCPWCGKPIKDISTAISDKNTDVPVHFDCVLERVISTEKLDFNDHVCYIGGGRFGVVHFGNSPDTRGFNIKKIVEWENKESRSDWRHPISVHYSII